MGIRRGLSAYWFLLLPAAVVAIVVLAWPSQAEAQCGSSASSCKNCHEVQGEYPVNASGEWHTSHAFGDFCEFCHAGNVQATEIEAAHTGMVYPLEDVNASCLSCHPNDVTEKAEVYAVALGVTVGAGAAGGDGGEDTEAGGTEAEAGAPEAAEANGVTAATEGGGEIIDYNSQYARTVLDERAPINVGNAILGFLSLALLAVGGVLLWRWEGLGARWQSLRQQPARHATAATATPAAVMEAGTEQAWRASGAMQSGALPGELATIIEQLDAPTVRALQKLLQDAALGSEMIQALASLDPLLVRRVAALDSGERALLVAVAARLSEELPPAAY